MRRPSARSLIAPHSERYAFDVGLEWAVGSFPERPLVEARVAPEQRDQTQLGAPSPVRASRDGIAPGLHPPDAFV